MKTIFLGVVAALALTVLPAVHAEDTRVSIKAPQVSHVPHYYMAGEEFRPYRNTYLLQNGQKITFKQRVSRLYAVLDEGEWVRIYATSPKTFVADSGAHFEFREEGEEVAISDFQLLPLAKVDNPNQSVMMASAAAQR